MAEHDEQDDELDFDMSQIVDGASDEPDEDDGLGIAGLDDRDDEPRRPRAPRSPRPPRRQTEVFDDDDDGYDDYADGGYDDEPDRGSPRGHDDQNESGLAGIIARIKEALPFGHGDDEDNGKAGPPPDPNAGPVRSILTQHGKKIGIGVVVLIVLIFGISKCGGDDESKAPAPETSRTSEVPDGAKPMRKPVPPNPELESEMNESEAPTTTSTPRRRSSGNSERETQTPTRSGTRGGAQSTPHDSGRGDGDDPITLAPRN